MYTKLEEYSNKYVTVYQGKKRLIFDFKHPRLFNRSNINMLGLVGTVSAPTSISISTTDNLNSDVNYFNPVSSQQINNSSVTRMGQPTVLSMASNNIVEVKTLVISERSNFGKIYILDSTGSPVRLKEIESKNISSAKIFHEFVKFIGQFNEKTFELAAAAIMPQETINIDNLSGVMTTLGGPVGVVFQQDYNSLKGYLLSFLYPVFKKMKYYIYTNCMVHGYAVSNNHQYSPIKSAPWYPYIKGSKSYVESLRRATGIHGNAFIKKMVELGTGQKLKTITVRHQDLVTKGVIDIKARYLGEDRHLAQKLGDDLATVKADIVTNILAGMSIRDVGMKIFNNPNALQYQYTYSFDKEGFRRYEMSGLASAVEDVGYVFETTTFYHFGHITYWNMFKDLVPLDYWFELDAVPDIKEGYEYNGATGYNGSPTILNWIRLQSESTKKKLFLNYQVNWLSDIVRQLEKFKHVDKLSPKAREIYPNGLEMPKKWKTTKELHDLISRDYNRIKALDRLKDVKYTDALMKLNGLDFGNNWWSELPKDTARIVEYGHVLGHCVASYADRCALDNETVILSINHNLDPIYTLELVRHHAAGYDENNVPVLKYIVRQFKGKNNSIPATSEVQHILEKILNTGLVSEFREPSYNTVYTGQQARLLINGQEIGYAGNIEYNIQNQAQPINQAAEWDVLQQAIAAGGMNEENTLIRDQDGVLNAARNNR